MPIRDDTPLPLVGARARAGGQRGHHLHDGCLRLDDRRAEGDRPHRVVLDRYLAHAASTTASRRRYIIHDAAAKEVDEHTFYHTRESGGTRISSAYKVCAGPDRRAVPAGGVEHLLLPVLRRRQLGRGQPAEPRACCSETLLPQVQPVLLRPGRKPLRQRRVLRVRCDEPSASEHENAGAVARSRTKKAIYDSIKKFLGKGK